MNLIVYGVKVVVKTALKNISLIRCSTGNICVISVSTILYALSQIFIRPTYVKNRAVHSIEKCIHAWRICNIKMVL